MDVRCRIILATINELAGGGMGAVVVRVKLATRLLCEALITRTTGRVAQVSHSKMQFSTSTLKCAVGN